MAKKQKTTNKEIENPNIAGSKGVDALAIDKVTGLFESYKKMRQFEQGGRTIIITDKWEMRDIDYITVSVMKETITIKLVLLKCLLLLLENR